MEPLDNNPGLPQAGGTAPVSADELNHRGIVLARQGRLDEAVADFQRAVQTEPENALAHDNLGLALILQGKLDEAIACCRRAVELKPDFAEAYSNLGRAWMGQGRIEEALACFRRSLAVKPGFAEAHNRMGLALQSQGKREQAAASFRAALQSNPALAEAYLNLGNVLKEEGQLDEAAGCYRQALQLKPNYAEAHSNLGTALGTQGRLDDAIACYRRALELKPDHAASHYNLGTAYVERGMLDEAMACYHRALEYKPDYAEAHWNQSLLWLLRGDFLRGFAQFEWRWKAKDGRPRNFSQAPWAGQPLDGKTILLHAEQGLGDTMQFIRYAPLVKRVGARVLVECPKPLVRLLAGCRGVDELIVWGDDLPPFDTHAPLLSLPRILHTVLETIPAEVPYLFPDAGLAERWRKELGPIAGSKIGIVWRGNPKHQNDLARSIPLSRFASLLSLPGVRFFSLQKGPGVEQLQDLDGQCHVTELGSRLDDFLDTAAVLVNLDLLITCDTAVAHLAGALGVPAWVALPLVPDWRWLLDRDDSPWYPTMRLFRQKRPGDWPGVMEQIRTAWAART